MSAKSKREGRLIDKKEFLLQSIIRAYIEHLEPIGSSQLKSMYDIQYSPATIRGYFKKLGDEGYLAQEHISSGRTPTYEALKEYWNARLNFNIEHIDFEMLRVLAKKLGLSVFIKQSSSSKLVNIINVEEKYLILEFEKFSITVRYMAPLHKFLSDMLGFELEHIMEVSRQVGAYELYNELSNKITNSAYEIVNIKNYLNIAAHYDLSEEEIQDFLKGTVMQKLRPGIYYEQLLPKGFIGICHDCMIDGEEIKVLVVGELSKDYEFFYERVVI
jgi:heat-inducible transcriptional repressor